MGFSLLRKNQTNQVLEAAEGDSKLDREISKVISLLPHPYVNIDMHLIGF